MSVFASSPINSASGNVLHTGAKIPTAYQLFGKRPQSLIDAHNARMRNLLGFIPSDEPFIDETASGSGAGSGYGGSSPVTYSDWSPAAKLFGMDQSTAYEEHLANTAHQREVADLRAAGLNPVLGLSSGAPTVSGSYVSGSGSGYGSTAKKTFFKDVADVLGSVAGLVVMAASKSSTAASLTSKAISQAGKLLDNTLE